MVKYGPAAVVKHFEAPQANGGKVAGQRSRQVNGLRRRGRKLGLGARIAEHAGACDGGQSPTCKQRMRDMFELMDAVLHPPRGLRVQSADLVQPATFCSTTTVMIAGNHPRCG
jgi:hypothetical protein